VDLNLVVAILWTFVVAALLVLAFGL